MSEILIFDLADVTAEGEEITLVENVVHFDSGGLSGPPGPQGEAATIAVGTTTLTPYGTVPTVTNSGTVNAAVLDFTFPDSASHYRHIQSAAARQWFIDHRLGYRPNVAVLDSAGTEWFGDVRHLDENRLIVTFANDFAGTAELS